MQSTIGLKYKGAQSHKKALMAHSELKIRVHRLWDFNLQVLDFLPDIAFISYYSIRKLHTS